MAYDLFIKRRIDEIEEKLLSYNDPIERLYVWFCFIKDFSQETHSLLDKQYTELVMLCKKYAETPDLAARADIRYQVTSCSREIELFNEQVKRIPRLQCRLEQEVIHQRP